ncbi:hypothetical protein ColTof4_06719 [Colletotrichum tofieldiae]|nr:hypothetical protein ColTof3_11661 [Colletotrichum tofieldiae]GKT74296.1 hypothetical protein ColTof4_06719 [Colletotrichum tofieldiae]
MDGRGKEQLQTSVTVASKLLACILLHSVPPPWIISSGTVLFVIHTLRYFDAFARRREHKMRQRCPQAVAAAEDLTAPSVQLRGGVSWGGERVVVSLTLSTLNPNCTQRVPYVVYTVRRPAWLPSATHDLCLWWEAV